MCTSYMHLSTSSFLRNLTKYSQGHVVLTLGEVLITIHKVDPERDGIALKKLPIFIDWFSWCTWDAFYTDVTTKGVKDGLKSFYEGGIPPRFLIIDDGYNFGYDTTGVGSFVCTMEREEFY
ncbi:hypothetical protein POM88_017151 [Heracleum sosnowskyi]|uniref:Uncharacterized protein n=1 Tax=Heracleum sosnowskyi TaxID=360622 RepID=A0AAD8IPR4_9APIA|nr:hypothetical protein POM88_017151 [Heracleum sosnowskyi]